MADDVGIPTGNASDDSNRDFGADVNSETRGVSHGDDRRGNLGGADSPWAHDLPISPPAPLPEAWTRVEPVALAAPPIASHLGEPGGLLTDPARPSQTHAAIETNGHRSRRSLLAVGVVGILVVAAIAAQAVVGGGRDDEGADGESAAGVATDGSAPTTDETSTTVVRIRIPSGSGGSGSASSVPATTADELPEAPRQWVTTPITLDPRLQTMTVPTQVVVLNADGILHVIDMPTGVLRSIDTKLDRHSDLAVVVADEAIAVTSYSGSDDVTVINMDGTVHDVAIPGSAGQIISRSGTNEFVVAPSSWSGDQEPPNILLAADGTMTDITNGPIADYGLWGVQYLDTTHEAVVTDSGGTYAFDAAGNARRLSTGTLIAVGERHLLLRECDEALTCEYARIPTDPGDPAGREVLTATELDNLRGFDPSVSLSPDGTLLTYFDWAHGPQARRLLDFEVGASVVVDSADQYYGNPAWAEDSSGIFIINDGALELYDRATGEGIAVAPGVDLGAIVAVAARPPAG